MYGSIAQSLLQVVRFNQDSRLLRVHSPIQPEPFIVHRLQGREGLSQPCDFVVDLYAIDAQLELKQLVGQPLGVTMPTADGDRYFHGYAREFSRIGADGGLAMYRAELAPWFAFLDYTSNCRIFQDLSVPDIVNEVFAGYADLADFRSDIDAGAHAPMPYCVQYNESDFAFVSRLLEDAGIYYYFEHAADRHVMVLADQSGQSDPIGRHAHVAFQSEQGVQHETGLDHWSARRRIGANANALKSFDFKQPRSALAVQQLMAQPHGVLPRLENYRYDGAARYGDSRVGEALAGVRSEEAVWQTKQFEGEGAFRSLFAGHYFVLDDHYDHAADDEEDRQFFIIEVTHDARNNYRPDFSEAEDSVYRGKVTCVRRSIAYRPPRQTPSPRMPGPQTATVTGPAGEEIWADRYGRVKLQFHWDRLGRFNDQSSCWVRVASPWAGSGMGGVSAPRIGQEVVVDFLDGNPDRPIITGRVYNEDNMPPFEKEVSGMRSKTVHGDGFNEVTMHDAAGSELLNMHAQKDMSTTVLNDHNSAVKNNKSTTVDANHSLNVGANQRIAVSGNQGVTVSGNHTSAITGSSSHDITGPLSSTVAGAVSETYLASQKRAVTGGYTEAITGDYGSKLNGNFSSQRNGTWTENVSGTSERSVAGASSETHGQSRSTNVAVNDTHQVGSNLEQDIGADHKAMVGGNFNQVAGGKHDSASDGPMTLASGSKMSLQVGGAGIEIVGGAIVISAGGSTIKIDGGGVSVDGAKISLN